MSMRERLAATALIVGVVLSLIAVANGYVQYRFVLREAEATAEARAYCPAVADALGALGALDADVPERERTP